MSAALASLEALELKSLDAKGKPPTPSRLTSAANLRAMHLELVQDDQGSAGTRVQIQGAKDGAAPFNQAKLNASGQGSRSNFNSLLMQDLITKANNGYNDIITSVKVLMTVEVEGGEEGERTSYARIIASELTRTIRKWKFTPKFLRLVDLFVTHGIGIAYFPDSRDFRFNVAGFGEFLIPRGTEASEEEIPYAIARKDMLATKLYDAIRDEKVAAKLGWDVEEVKAAIGRATTKSTSSGSYEDIERMQRQVKNNDVMADRQFAHIPVLHGWVREFDGTLSYFIAEKDAKGDAFLFKEHSRFQSVDEAFVFYAYGIGNGTYHGIRGMGHMIFALCQLHSRMMCQKADGEMIADSIIIQATDGRALQEASLNTIGPFAMLTEGFDVVDRKTTSSNLGNLGYLGEVKALIGQFSNRFMVPAEGGRKGEAYQNRDAISSQQEAIANGDAGAVDLFYTSHDRIIREMCRRIIKGPKSDRLVAEFHRRVARAGITQEILDSVDHDSTYAFRALGAGSPAARSLAFTKLMQLLPQLDEIGRKNAIYEFVASLVGFQNVDQYASKAEEPRYNSEASLAYLENVLLSQGHEVPVLAYQMHGTHEMIHIPPLLQLLEGVDVGDIDPMEILPGLRSTLAHIAAHGEQLAQDPTQAALYGQVREAVNNLKQVVDNMEKKIKAEQRDAGTGAEGETGQADATAAIEMKKLELIQFKLELAQKKGDLELSIMEAKANQNLALNDLKGEEQVRKKMQYPQSDFSQRR